MKEQSFPMLSPSVENAGVHLINGIAELATMLPPVVLGVVFVWITWKAFKKPGNTRL